uniref:Uncharacterized protein n=1 Tax=viral metagenome TaxID=1070528 RepID=A0A6C0LLN3_9ZZZZ
MTEVGICSINIGGDSNYVIDEFKVDDNTRYLNLENTHPEGKIVVQLGSNNINSSFVVRNSQGDDLFDLNAEGTLTLC